MTRLLCFLLLASATCMEMKETVERMVMVRKTGSDLLPAATGFIYKKDNDGPVSVVKMGETEVLEHLKQMPSDDTTGFIPLPMLAPFYSKDGTNERLAYNIPADEDKIKADDYYKDFSFDGIDDYANNDEYGYNGDFKAYMHNLGNFHEPADHVDEEYNGDEQSEIGDLGKSAYSTKHNYDDGNGNNYHEEKHESFSISNDDDEQKHYGDSDAFTNRNGYGGRNRGNKEDDASFKDEYKKDDVKKDFYNQRAFNDYGKHSDEHKYASAEVKAPGNDDVKGFHERKFYGDGALGDTGADTSGYGAKDRAAKVGKFTIKSFTYEVNHR